MNNLAAKTWVPREGRWSEPQESRRDRYDAGEVVSRDIEGLERGLVERRDGSVEPVPFEAEIVEPVEAG